MGSHFSRGLLLIDQKKYDLALEEFRLELSEEPESPDATCMMAYCFEELDRLDEAHHWCREAINLDPHNALAFHTLGRVLHRQNPGVMLDAALDALKTSISLNPRLTSSYSYIAFIYSEHYNWKQSLEAIDQGLSIDGGDAELFALRGWCLFHMGKEKEAYQLFEQSLAIDSEVAATRYFLGRMNLVSGNYECAKMHLAEASRLNPHLYQTQNLMSEILKAEDRLYRNVLFAAMKCSHHRDSHPDMYNWLLAGWFVIGVSGCLLTGNPNQFFSMAGDVLTTLFLAPLAVFFLGGAYWVLVTVNMSFASGKKSYIPTDRKLAAIGVLLCITFVFFVTSALCWWLDGREAQFADELATFRRLCDHEQFSGASEGLQRAVKRANDNWSIGAYRMLLAANKSGFNQEHFEQSKSDLSEEEGVSYVLRECYESLLQKVASKKDRCLTEKIYGEYAAALKEAGNQVQAEAVAKRCASETGNAFSKAD